MGTLPIGPCFVNDEDRARIAPVTRASYDVVPFSVQPDPVWEVTPGVA